MSERLAVFLITLLVSIVTIPYMFVEGAIFDIPTKAINDCGEVVTVYGHYYNNVSFILFISTLMSLSISLPFFRPNLSRFFKMISLFLGGWFMASLIYEIFTLMIPPLLMETAEDYKVYAKILFGFLILIVGNQINETWKKNILTK